MPGNSWVARQIDFDFVSEEELNLALADKLDTADRPAELAELDVPSGTPGAAIEDLTVTGDYAADDDNIEAAINDILAVLRGYGMIADSV